MFNSCASKLIARLTFFIFLHSSHVFAVTEFDPTTPPGGWSEFLRLDREFNIYSRRKEIISGENLEVVPVYYLDINHHGDTTPNKCWMNHSRWSVDTNLISLRPLMRFPMNCLHVRHFFLDDEFAPIKFHGTARPKTPYLGLRMSGRNSYFVWNGADKREFYIVKFIGRDEKKDVVNQSGVTPTHTDYILRAIEADTDFLNKIENEFRLGFMVEILSSKFNGHTQTIRLPYVIHFESTNDSNQNHYPNHGLLGEEMTITKTIKDKNWSLEDWIRREYIPKWAKIFSYLHFKRGIFLDSHTQNMVVALSQDGELFRGVLKDFGVVYASQIFTFGPNGEFVPNVISRFGVDKSDNFEENKEFGYHTSFYLIQSFALISENDQSNRSYTLQFITQYIKEVEKLFSISVNLSEDSRLVLADLPFGWRSASKKSKIGYVAATLAPLFNEIFDQVMDHRLKTEHPVDSKILDFSNKSEQKILAKIFKQHLKGRLSLDYTYSWAYKVPFNKLKMVYHNAKIWAYSPNHQKWIGVAYGLSETEQSEVLSLQKPATTSVFSNCLKLLKN